MKVMRWAAMPVLLLSMAACGSDGGSGSGSKAAWCDIAQNVEDEFNGIGDEFNADNPDLKGLFDKLVPDLEDAAAAAPDEIKDAVVTTQEAVVKINGLLKDADYNLLDLDLGEMQAIMGDQAVGDAGDQISAYNEKECGIAADTTTATEDSSTDTVVTGTARDQIVTSLTTLGFTEEEATCVAENVDPALAAEIESDPTAMSDVLDKCGIDLGRLTQIGSQTTG